MSRNSDADAGANESSRRTHHSHRHFPPLPLWLRILLLGAGWFIVLIGLVGLALPGIQGILTIAVGAAVLSVASEMVYRWLRRLLHRWPRVWHPIETLREKVHEWFARRKLHKK